MSLHGWVRKNLAAYVAGGLSAAERRRVVRHVGECAECARTLDGIQSGDRTLTALFEGVRPGPALEDEAVRRLRLALPAAGRRRLSRTIPALLAVAAALFLAAAGAGLSVLIEQDKLRLPGGVERQAAVGSEALVLDDTRSVNINSVTDNSVFLALAAKDSSKAHAESYRSLVSGKGKELEALGRRGPGESYRGLTQGTTDLGVNFNLPQIGLNVLAFSPDGRTSAKAEKKPLLGIGTASEYGMQVWDSTTKKGGGAAAPDYFKPGASFAPPGQERTKTPPAEGRERKVQEKIETTSEGQDRGKPGKDVRDEPPPVRMPEPVKGGEKANPQPPAAPKVAGPPVTRKIIRSGEVEFEVDSFDAAVAVINRLVAAIKGGFVATVNSDKLANGKVRGSVVVRVPPEQLDALVLGLRKELGKHGELKGQRIGSQDVTKQYTDLESRLKAARTMEQRLLTVIREAKGQIKDLVLAEKELGVWRTRVEELEGELRYYANLVALSTLTINLTEKNIRTAAGVVERECVQAGAEVEDVEAAMRALHKAVAEAQGRITRSEMRQHGARQFSALLHFEVAPDKAGPIRDRLRQLGNVTRLDIDRVQQPENGGTLPRDGRLQRGDTQFRVSLYNLANVEPRETVTLTLAAADVAAAHRTLGEAVAKAGGHVVDSQLNEQDRQNITARLDFDVRRAEESALRRALAQAGEILSRNVTRKAETGKDKGNLTDAKLLFKVELLPTAAVPPRETVALAVEVPDVEAALAILAAQVKEAGGTVVVKGDTQEAGGRATARVHYRLPLAAMPGVLAKVRSAGHVRIQKLVPNPKAPEGKFAVAELDVTLTNGELLVPSEQGLWAQLRRGLSVSLRGLAWSASWLIVGLLFVLPWVLLVYAVIWVVRRLWRRGDSGRGSTPAPAAPPTSG